MTLLVLSETIKWLGAFFSIHCGWVLPNSLSFVNNYSEYIVINIVSMQHISYNMLNTYMIVIDPHNLHLKQIIW